MGGIIGGDFWYELEYNDRRYWVEIGYLEQAGKFLNNNPTPQESELPRYMRLL